MTIAALLSHFGIGTRRYVTADGLILFDGVSGSSASGYNHSQFGAVTPVPAHTFHGDQPEPDDAQNGDGSPWWLESSEMGRHVDAVKAAFPRFTKLDSEDSAPPVWVGKINTGRGEFTVGIIVREDRGLPFVRVLKGPKLGIPTSGRWIHSPHLYLNGTLCIADQSDWDPDTHTVATAIAWTAHWLAAFTEWRFTHKWPVAGTQTRAA